MHRYNDINFLLFQDNAVEIEHISNKQRFHVPKLSTTTIENVYEDSSSCESSSSEADKKVQKVFNLLNQL